MQCCNKQQWHPAGYVMSNNIAVWFGVGVHVVWFLPSHSRYWWRLCTPSCGTYQSAWATPYRVSQRERRKWTHPTKTEGKGSARKLEPEQQRLRWPRARCMCMPSQPDGHIVSKKIILICKLGRSLRTWPGCCIIRNWKLNKPTSVWLMKIPQFTNCV